MGKEKKSLNDEALEKVSGGNSLDPAARVFKSTSFYIQEQEWFCIDCNGKLTPINSREADYKCEKCGALYEAVMSSNGKKGLMKLLQKDQ